MEEEKIKEPENEVSGKKTIKGIHIFFLLAVLLLFIVLYIFPEGSNNISRLGTLLTVGYGVSLLLKKRKKK